MSDPGSAGPLVGRQGAEVGWDFIPGDLSEI